MLVLAVRAAVDDGGFDPLVAQLLAGCLLPVCRVDVWGGGGKVERWNYNSIPCSSTTHTHRATVHTQGAQREAIHYPQYRRHLIIDAIGDQVQRYSIIIIIGRQPDISRDTLLLSHTTHSVGRACMNDPTHALPPSPGTNLPSLALPNTAQAKEKKL